MLQSFATRRRRIGRVQVPHKDLSVLIAQCHRVAPEIKRKPNEPDLASLVLEPMYDGNARIARLWVSLVLDTARLPADD